MATSNVASKLWLLSLFLVLLAGCYSSPDLSFQSVKSAGVIRIGYSVEPPYAYLQSSGEVTGESPELAKVIVQRLGISRIEWQMTNFGSLLSDLEAARFDVVAAGLFQSPHRWERVSFSRPTFRVRSALLVRKGFVRLSDESYEGLAKAPGVSLAVLDNSIEEFELKTHGMSAAQLTVVPDAISGAALVSAGRVDGLALSAPTVRWFALHNSEHSLECLELADDTHLFVGGFAFRKGDTALRDAWDRELQVFVGKQEHVQLTAPFGFLAQELQP